MLLKINYLKTQNKPSSNIVLFSDEKYKINSLRKHLKNDEYLFISDLIKTRDLKKNLLVFELKYKKKVVIIYIKNKFKTADVESLGAEFLVELITERTVNI